MDSRDKLAISVTEAAALLGVSRPTLYRLARTEGFPAFTIGGRTLISAQELARWVSDQARHGAPDRTGSGA